MFLWRIFIIIGPAYNHFKLPRAPCSRASRRRCRPSCRGISAACTCRNLRCARARRSRAECCPVSSPWEIMTHNYVNMSFVKYVFISSVLFSFCLMTNGRVRKNNKIQVVIRQNKIACACFCRYKYVRVMKALLSAFRSVGSTSRRFYEFQFRDLSFRSRT